jgi:hypothetical protein
MKAMSPHSIPSQEHAITSSPFFPFALLFLFATSSCSQLLALIPGVTIRSPSEGDALLIGQPFRLLADSDLEGPQYAVSRFEIKLWDVNSGYSTTWEVESTANDRPNIADEFLLVPEDAPPGEQYRLTVSVLPGGPAANDTSLPIGDTVKVRVSYWP